MIINIIYLIFKIFSFGKIFILSLDNIFNFLKSKLFFFYIKV
jgi:hypothetical protein